MFRALLFKPIFYIGTALFVLVLFVFAPFMKWRTIYKTIQAWCRFILGVMRVVVGITIEWRGLERLPTDRPYILSSKHESTLDAFTVLTVIPNANAIAKSQLFYYPALGFLLRRLKIIPVERGSGEGHKRLPDLKRIVEMTGRPLMLFPEGTRVPLGARYPLKSGVWHVQRETGLDIYPVATNAACFWPKNYFWMRPGRVVYAVQSPIPVGLEKEMLLEHLEQAILVESDALRPDDAPCIMDTPISHPKHKKSDAS